MAFRGMFWHWDMLLTGLDWKYFNFEQMEFHGQISLLKTGIVFADAVTTVSPTYARDPDARVWLWSRRCAALRRQDFVGILNGVDTKIWNPQTDPALPAKYSITDVEEGKRVCKRHLQEEFGLPVREDVPLLAMVSRLTDQKGFDLVLQAAETLLTWDLQLCVLGSGEARYQDWFADLSRRAPEKVAIRIGFDESLAHRIEAGADMFLMPSQFEPCGLNQMYSLLYGTVPIVRAVGGLADSVVDASPENVAHGTATGFSFTTYSAEQLMNTIERALALFANKPEWLRLVRAGMNQDWSWRRSALQYLRVYEKAVAKRHTALAAPTVSLA